MSIKVVKHKQQSRELKKHKQVDESQIARAIQGWIKDFKIRKDELSRRVLSK
jgi:hypothetical protein